MFGFSLALFAILCACNDTLPAGDQNTVLTKAEKKTEKDSESSSKKNVKQDEDAGKTQVLNNISINTQGGVEVYRAFLSYSGGNLVPASNTTSLGEPVYLNLNITKGWEEENGMVSLGAAEKISTDNGTVLLDEADLFKNSASFNADDAKFIRLKAVVNSMSGPIRYFVVDYKVWDKNGDGAIQGSYKFYIE